MNRHKGARLTPYSRALLVKRITCEGLRAEEAAQAAGVSVRTAYKWLKRHREEGDAGLHDRSSRPHHGPHQTSAAQVQAMIQLRRERQTYRPDCATPGFDHEQRRPLAAARRSQPPGLFGTRRADPTL